jgi:hypothetical protein
VSAYRVGFGGLFSVVRKYAGGVNMSHQSAWICDLVQHLSALFRGEVPANLVLSNRLYLVLRNRPDRIAQS